jgi:hypothetical protein
MLAASRASSCACRSQLGVWLNKVSAGVSNRLLQPPETLWPPRFEVGQAARTRAGGAQPRSSHPPAQLPPPPFPRTRPDGPSPAAHARGPRRPPSVGSS